MFEDGLYFGPDKISYLYKQIHRAQNPPLISAQKTPAATENTGGKDGRYANR